MTGKWEQADGRRQTAARNQKSAGGSRCEFNGPSLPSAVRRLPTARGFTLLELMIVITIIIILAAVILPKYQQTILVTRESVLREDLYKLRSLLDQYAADKQKLPQDLNDLVTAGYLRELPKDPMTGEADWTPETGTDPNSGSDEQGIINVHSASADTSSEGTTYNTW